MNRTLRTHVYEIFCDRQRSLNFYTRQSSELSTCVFAIIFASIYRNFMVHKIICYIMRKNVTHFHFEDVKTVAVPNEANAPATGCPNNFLPSAMSFNSDFVSRNGMKDSTCSQYSLDIATLCESYSM